MLPIYNMVYGCSGRRKAAVIIPEVPTNTFILNYNLYDELVSDGWNGNDDVNVTITIPETTIIGSSSNTLPSFDISYSFSSNSVINIINYGYIVGIGGAGGYARYGAGGAGGDAINIIEQASGATINIDNQGTIGGGGGGGGAGGVIDSVADGGGGGGGAGYNYGTAGQNQPVNGTAPTAGTLTTGGTYGISGNGANPSVCRGGMGGDLGVNGGAGLNGGSGGAAGKAINGVDYITFINQGTILGTTI